MSKKGKFFKLKNYLCILSSDGRFKKVLFDEDMIKSNRIFSITKLKNSTCIIDSFILNKEQQLVILTSIGRLFKFDLSDKNLNPSTKHSLGPVSYTHLTLPTKRIV